MQVLNASIVIKGAGFTPQIVGADTFASVFAETPRQVVSSPVLTLIDYPSLYQIIVNEDRFEIRRSNPTGDRDEMMKRSVHEALRLWPLVRPEAIGVNFVIGGNYGDSASIDELTSRLSAKGVIEALAGAPILGSAHSFTFQVDRARVTLKVTTDAIVQERAGYLIDLNAHYEPATDIDAIIASQSVWYTTVNRWARELVNDH